MKNILIIAFVSMVTLLGCKKDQGDSNSSIVSPLTTLEKNDLTFLREEELLAHDVYVYANNKYGSVVFSNISSSELKHTNAIKGLLDKYSVVDPAVSHVSGVFNDTLLQSLYNQLVIKVNESKISAYYVGATIEDLDINDIHRFYANTQNSDLISVYANLTCGSRNHIRSFVSQLGSYKAQFISDTELSSILIAGHESCGNN